MLGMLLEMLLTPLELMFKYTCPPCEFGTKWESLYPVRPRGAIPCNITRAGGAIPCNIAATTLISWPQPPCQTQRKERQKGWFMCQKNDWRY